MTTDAPADVATDLRKLDTDDSVRFVFGEWALTATVTSSSYYQPAAFVEGMSSAGELWVDIEATDDECDRLDLPSRTVHVVAEEHRIGRWRLPTATVRRVIYDDAEEIVGEDWDDLGRIESIEDYRQDRAFGGGR